MKTIDRMARLVNPAAFKEDRIGFAWQEIRERARATSRAVLGALHNPEPKVMLAAVRAAQAFAPAGLGEADLGKMVGAAVEAAISAMEQDE